MFVREELEKNITEVVKDLFGVEAGIELTRPDEQFGDYATNIALQLAKQVGKNPREVAEEVAAKLRETLKEAIQDVTVAGPGFINITVQDTVLRDSLHQSVPKSYHGETVVVEFGDPNPLKAMHLGHLYTTIAGDAISGLLELAGAHVERVSYHGDVGMHVAKAIYGIGTTIDWDVQRLQNTDNPFSDLAPKVGTAIGLLYAKGAQAYEESDEAKQDIKEINGRVYDQDDETINTIYKWGVEKSFAFFDEIFAELGVKYQKRYLESQASPIGVAYVKEHVGTVFEKSDGAIVYRGEQDGLHTRVFINSEGRPTYEAKDLGLTQLKQKDYPDAVRSVIITANEQTEYFKVMLAALAKFDPAIAAITKHIAHGFLSLTTGKMSSRTGQVHEAEALLDAVHEAVKRLYPDSEVQQEVYLAAVKYTFLKQRIGGDIVFDVEESVALEGNSGPYLQYAHARARSILQKAGAEEAVVKDLEPAERSLARKLSEYPEVAEKAMADLLPHYICTYLYELSQHFNRFYEHNRVIGDARQSTRLALVKQYANILQSGLQTLGIPAPEKM